MGLGPDRPTAEGDGYERPTIALDIPVAFERCDPTGNAESSHSTTKVDRTSCCTPTDLASALPEKPTNLG